MLTHGHLNYSPPLLADVTSFPIVVVEGGDVSVFPSILDAEEHLEMLEASGRAYFAFDAEGRTLKVEGGATPGDAELPEPGKVRIELAEANPTHAADLLHLLRDYLKSCGERVGGDATLADLVRRCWAIHLYRE